MYLQNEIVSMGVYSDGSYNVPKGLIYSFPVRTFAGGRFEIVQVCRSCSCAGAGSGSGSCADVVGIRTGSAFLL
jgi:hypothetical protein